MYCSHCGAQIPDDSAFCPSCGQKPGRAGDPAVQTAAPQSAPPPQTSYAQPAPRYVETIQTEAEFIRNYRSLNHYEIYTALYVACRVIDIVFGIIYIIVMISDMSSHQIAAKYFTEYFFEHYFFKYIVVLLGVEIGIGILEYLFRKKAKSIDAEAKSAYKSYLYKINGGTPVKSLSSIFSDSNSKNLGYSSKANPPRTSIPANGWRCPDCGRVNASYVGTCACGRRKNS